jgi:uncharacterized protein (TIGR03437 family)
VATKDRLVLLSLFTAASGAAGLSADDTTPAAYIIQTVAGSDASSDGGSALATGLSQPEGIAVDSSGNVYFADAAAQRVYKIAVDGSLRTVAGTGVGGFSGDGGPASAALLNQPYGLALDPAGNLYIADLGNARVRKIGTDGSIQTVAGGGVLPGASTGQGGPATLAQLAEPRNVALGADGSLYISDFGANQVYQVSIGGTLSLAAGTGTAGFSGGGTSALLAELNAPAGLAVDASGALYIADSGNNYVRKVYDGVITAVFPTHEPTGLALDSTGLLYVAAASYFGTVIQPISGVASARDVALDASGHIYFTSGQLVYEISNLGTATAIAGSGNSPSLGGDGGAATSAQLNSPSGVAVSASAASSGNFYLADTANNRIRMVTPAGIISTVAGTGQPGYSGDQGPASGAQLNAPRGMAFDNANNLYVADSGNNAVRKITPAGTITTIASQLNNPVSVAVGALGSVYIADSGNNRIVEVMADGTASTFAELDLPLAVAVDASGNVVAADATQIWNIASDGSPSSLIQGLSSPGSIAFAPDGTLCIADTGANVIRQLSTSGVLTAIAGTGTAGFSGDGSAALAAELSGPAGLAIGPHGTLLVADSGNNRIRSLTPVAIAPQTAMVTVVNAASLTIGPIAPGEIVTIFGSGFGANPQLLFDGQPATLFYTSATQINALAPASLATNPTAQISIVVDGAAVAGSSVQVAASAPGIFTATGATGQAAAVNQDGTLNSPSHRAVRGSIVSLYATGQGSGMENVSLTIDGYSAALFYAGPAPGFPGLMQINAQIPSDFPLTGVQPVLLSVGGSTSQAGVTIVIY